MKKIIIIGAGLGGLSIALRLSKNLNNKITIIEKYSTPGGRLNILEKDGFTFDLGPSFMSMTYEFDNLFKDAEVSNPLHMKELDPIYQVYFENRIQPYKIFKDLKKLEEEFKNVEPNLAEKLNKYLSRAGEFFHDTELQVVQSNYKGMLDYFYKMSKVPFKHIPYLFRTMWDELDKNFSSEEIKIIFSLVAFFLGSTPFQTPSIYSLLSYTEMRHNGYWSIHGGMYSVVKSIVDILTKRGVEFVYNTEIIEIENNNGKLAEVVRLMCLKVFCNGESIKYNELVHSAKMLGSAFQKVNFLRDINSDLKDRKRIYLPDVHHEMLINNTNKKSLEFEIEEEFYEALKGILKLPIGVKLGVYSAYLYYLMLFKKIKRLDVKQLMSKRVRISNFHKFYLFLKSFWEIKVINLT